MKFACGLVSYFPNEDVLHRVIEYSKTFDHVFVIDNTPHKKKNNFSLKTLLGKKYTKIDVMENGSNKGLSFAYNYFLTKTKNSYDVLCLLDQDSIFHSKDINNMKHFIQNNNYLKETAIFSPKVVYKDEIINRVHSLKFINFAISSGSFINLDIVKNNPDIFFDENYFIDRVDTDFCKVCREKEYRIIENEDALLFQMLGDGGKKYPQHNYIRHYYIFRNRFYYNKKHFKFYRVLTFMQTLKQCLHILIYEDNKTKKIEQVRFGFLDYKKGLMGRGRYNG